MLSSLIKCITKGFVLVLVISLPTCRQAIGNIQPHNEVEQSTLKHFATTTNNRYYKDLSKSTSDLPSRDIMAFFVPNICKAPQASQMDSTAVLYPLQGNTVYDGLTLQNKKALWRICRAVSCRTESKTRHPILTVLNTVYSVALTQKLQGVSHHG